MKEIPKTYSPQEVEDKIYKKWENSGYFNPDNLELPKNAEKFSIAMPPPNATGILHIGHASMLAYQDLMIRYNRMKRKRTLWLPGTDHAAIATQSVVEKLLAKEGKTKYDLGREKFLARVNKFVESSKNTIRRQVKKMGSSCDWSRERYTLDKGLSQAVKEVFVKMYREGLIYRGYRIVNWCPRCESTLADDEVEYKEERMPFYYFKYGPIVIGTARPETKFADKVIVVHPDDARYKNLIGKTFVVPWIEGDVEAKVIADSTADKDFGSGAMTITPAHSFEDFQLAQKYGIEVVKIIDEKGNLTKVAGSFAGMNANKARKAIVEKMKQKGLVNRIDENYAHNLSVCYRCGTPIEPLPSLQWFINVDKPVTIKGNKYFKNKSLKEAALEVVKGGEIEIIPKRFKKIYFLWMENLHDWCISRQFWFGHRIPVWYKDKSKVKSQKSKVESKKINIENQEIYVGVEAPKGEEWVQDSDTLDTWFSSGLWTFSTLLDRDFKKYKTFEEWLKNSPDLKKFHPTSVMETGYDILFFWIARMILMTTYALGEIPFEMVYLHGMVRDKLGRKMSKSLGNGIDPLDMIAKYGTDALRLSMIIGSSPGGDIKLYEEKIAGYRNFVNKLWNISRYVLSAVNIEKLENDKKPNDSTLLAIKGKTLADAWIMEKAEIVFGDVTDKIENYEFSAAGEILRDFTWSDFADWYIEISKIEKNKDEVLVYILKNLLKLWHPFTPFVTENVWSLTGKDENKLLMIESWPVKGKVIYAGRFRLKAADSPKRRDVKNSLFTEFELIKNIIISIRNLRSENKIEPALKIKAIFVARDKRVKDLIESQKEVIKGLARLSDFTVETKKGKIDKAVSVFVSEVEIYLPLKGAIDFEKELEKIGKKIKEGEKQIAAINKNLTDKNFLAKAPLKVVEEFKKRIKAEKENIAKLNERKMMLSVQPRE